MAIAFCAALAFFVKIFPAFAQDNRFWIALLLPLHVAFALILTRARSTPIPIALTIARVRPGSGMMRHRMPRAAFVMNEPTPPPSDQPMLVNCIAYSTDGRKLRDITLDEISDVPAGPRTRSSGSDCTNPTKPCSRKLQEEFGLHDLAIEDAHNAHQRPKIELYDDSLFIVLHTAQVVAAQDRIRRDAHLPRPATISSPCATAPRCRMRRRARVASRIRELLALGPSYALYAVLDFIVDNFLPIVEHVQGRAARTRKGHLRGHVQSRSRSSACTCSSANW